MWQERAPASERDASRETFPGLLVPSQPNEHHRWGSLKPQKCILSQFWSFEIPGSLLPASGGGWRSMACSCITAAPASSQDRLLSGTSCCLPSVCPCVQIPSIDKDTSRVRSGPPNDLT